MDGPAVKAAILGPGNIGTDLLLKLERSPLIDVVLVSGIYADSSGLKVARGLGIDTSDAGVVTVVARDDVELVFDATSARAHIASAPVLRDARKKVIDLTPAALGPAVVPGVSPAAQLDSDDLNLISCGAQATVPLVHAISRTCRLFSAEVVATIASASAGPGTRENIDEFTRTTAQSLVDVGGAEEGKAIIVLNPAEPPITMRNTVYATVSDHDERVLQESIESAVADVQRYVPGFRLLLFELTDGQATIMVEVEGAGDFLPYYAGNLDIMTSAAVRVGEEIAARLRTAVTTSVPR